MAESGNHSAIMTKITSLLSGVTGVYNVQSRERRVTDWKKYYSIFKHPTKKLITGWIVTRSKVDEEYLTNCEIASQSTYKIIAFYSVDDDDEDATEVVFNSLIEKVRDAFRADYDLDGTCEYHDPFTNIVFDYVLYGSVLCHRATGQIIAHERLNGGT